MTPHKDSFVGGEDVEEGLRDATLMAAAWLPAHGLTANKWRPATSPSTRCCTSAPTADYKFICIHPAAGRARVDCIVTRRLS